MKHMDKTIAAYNTDQAEPASTICEQLAELISAELTEATSKIWHGAPVWFLDDNPVVGYWVRKNHVQLLFWSGQSFDEPGLQPEGSFKAAEARYIEASQIDSKLVRAWLKKARDIQWDYKNIVKHKGVLERLK